MKNNIIIFAIILLLNILYACSNGTKQSQLQIDKSIINVDTEFINKIVDYDLDSILRTDTLRAITVYGPTSYFLYKGQPMGFEYELLKKLSNKLNLNLKIIIAKNIDEMFDMLNRGEGDVIAYGLTVTNNRKQHVSFTNPYMQIHQVLIQQKPEKWRQLNQTKMKKNMITDVTQLAGKTISVRKNTSYYERIINLSKEIGETIKIDIIDGELTTSEIIEMVSKGEIKYTIADNNIASISNAYFNNIYVETPVSLSQNLAWAVRKTSVKLLNRLNNALLKEKGSTYFNVVYNKYFKNKRDYVKRVKNEFYSKSTGKISKYDKLIQKYSNNVGFDWLLISSVVYQESQFINKRFSWAGAGGLMQLMPSTANDLGVKDMHNPSQNIWGGTRYLKKIWTGWSDISDSIQRLKFTLASYNCGYYHVKDAQYLARYYKKDSLSWDNGVDKFILKLMKPKYYNHKGVKYGYCRGREPYNYVNEIFTRYEVYKDLVCLGMIFRHKGRVKEYYSKTIPCLLAARSLILPEFNSQFLETKWQYEKL